MAGKEEGRKLALKLKNVRNFLGGLFQGSKNTTSAKNVSSADEACDESFNAESVIQKEALIDWSTAGNESRSKGNDDSNASRKDFLGTGNADLSGLVERGVDTREGIIKTFKFDEEPQSAKTMVQNNQDIDSKREVDNVRESIMKTVKIDEKPQSVIQNRNNQNMSKGVERPRPCKFKTEDGLWLCEVCSWSSSDSTSLSFLNHCSTTEHREKMRGRFGSEQELWRSQPPSHSLSEVKSEARESKANSQFAVWSETKVNGEISGVKLIQKNQAQNTEKQNEKSNIWYPEKPRTEMMYKIQQAQNRVFQESSRQEALPTSSTKGSLKEGSPPVQELLELLTVSHLLSGSKGQNDKKKVNEMKPEVGGFKEKLFEVMKKEGVKELSKKKRKKKANKKTKCGTDKEEKNSKVSTWDTNGLCKEGGQGGAQSLMDISRIEELRRWLQGLGIVFIEPITVDAVRCEVCHKSVPAGSNFETMVINVGTHVEGRGHAKKLSQILESSNAIVSLMKSIQKGPTANPPSLIQKDLKKGGK